MKKGVFARMMNKVWSFLKVCIDFYIKSLYNVEGKLLKLYQNGQKTAFFLAFAIVFAVFSRLSVFSVDAEDELTLDLEAFCDYESGMIRVSVVNAYSTELCGLLFDVCYDPAAFIFESAEKGDGIGESFELSYCDLGGRVRIIIDGNENCDEKIIATLRFSAVYSSEFKSLDFSLFDETEAEAYRFAGKSVVRIGLVFGKTVFSNTGEAAIVTFIEVEDSKDGGTTLSFGGAVFGEAFAAGVEVTVISLADLGTERVLLSGILPLSSDREKRFCFVLELPRGGDICIIVRPVAYKKDGAEFGEAKTFVV